MQTAKSITGLILLTVSVACSSTPTSPSRQVTDIGAGAALAGGAQTQANGGQQSGTASVVFVEVSPGVFGFAEATRDGVSGREVILTGDIVGVNFEPGQCIPGVDMTLGFPTSCVVFGTGPGQFVRAHPGQTAFTTCECSIGGVGNAGDQFVLKISYPPATPPQYPFGFTKFTFQNGTGSLSNLRGHGTLDFAADPAVSFTYHFAGN